MRGGVVMLVALAVAGAACKSGTKSDGETSSPPPDRGTIKTSPPKTSGAKGGDPRSTRIGDAPTGQPAPSESDKASGDTPPSKVEPEHEMKLLGKVDYADLARVLAKAGACAGDEPLPATLPSAYTADYCKKLDEAIQSYRRKWLDKARPFFDKLVPAGLPTTVVYPFAGADLVSVLAVFPKATDITTLSLEPAGDPRPIRELDARALQKELTRVRTYASRLLRINHNRTVDMSRAMTWGKLPGHIIFTLVGLSIHGYEPVSMKYFLLEPDGAIRYIPSRDVDELAKAPDNKRQKVSHMVLPHRLKPWANVEIKFRKQGDDSADLRVYRHIRANLHNGNLDKDRRVLEHLRGKGRVTAMTKAASYLLWKSSFSRIRTYLLKHIEWMVSDATGIPPEVAKKAGFEQLTYGRWTKPIADSVIAPERVEAIKKFWVKNRVGWVPFLFGYPGGPGGLHLMVTRPRGGG